MMTKNLFFRAFRKLHVLPYLNATKCISFDKSSFNIPVLNELGYPNLFLAPNWLYWLIRELIPADGAGFIDVGANIGQTLLAVKATGHQIQYIGFEPSVSCGYYLKTLIEANGFSDCRVYNFALSDSLKEAFLETNGKADPTGSMVTDLRPDFFTQRESVLALDYDRLSISTTIRCIKIDVEGGELETLMGMQNLIARDRPFIICEILDSFSSDVLNFTQQRANRVCELLQKHSYSIIQLVQTKQADRIVGFHEIDTVSIKQWTNESAQRNDYVFYPTEARDAMVAVLTKICL
jgi:FkbM family methyltransferase